MAREPHRSSEILDAVALLVVDMQDAFLNVMPDREAVLRRTAFAIEAARAFGIKVIFTEQVPARLGPTHADLLSLAPEARVFAKNEFSALLAEGLQDYLRRINVYHLLLAGIETPICIYQTALHAQDNDLDVTLLSDCTMGRRPDDCVIVLEALSRAECHVLPAETVFYSMLGTSLNPRFAHFTRIVKRYAGEDPIDGTPTPPPEPDARPARDERRDAPRRGDERRQGGDRGRGDRRRHPGRPDAGEIAAEAAADEASTEELRAEDGISEDEANQPSYEEATADHSAVEGESAASEPVMEDDRPSETAPRAEASAASDDAAGDGDGDDAASDEAASGEDEDGEGAPKKRRGRRRRGGARRRRARERAAANGDQTEGARTEAGPGETAPTAGESAESSPVRPDAKEGGAPVPSPDGPPLP